MNKEEFIKFVAEIAVKDWKDRRIMLPSVVIAQACKESAFGTSELAKNAKALFGIKLNGWAGKSYLKKADEQNSDGSMRTDPNALWRAYESWEESIIDHSTYIAERKVGNQAEPNFKAIVGETDVLKVIAGLVGDKNRLATAERCTDPELKEFVLEGKSVYPYATGLNYPQSLLDDYILKYNLTQYDNLEEVNTMSKKVFIGVGHGGSDPGASKYIVEKNANLVMALACRDYLEKNGVIVQLSRGTDENDPVSEEVKECNAFAPDLAVDIHNNAGGGDGFEAIVSIKGGTGRTLAENIEAEVKRIGQNSRGIKTRTNSKGSDYFAFIRSTKCPAVILEGVFVDNATDVKIADTTAEQKSFGEAYAKGILKTLGIVDKIQEKDNTPFKVKVSITNLNIRAGAGTNYAKVKYCPVGIYTITEVKAGKGSVKGWGKLKSGAGWISLDFADRV